MHPKDREAALENIRTSKSTRVILISFKAGSTGLNLTACNNVILVDLWWNPALEVHLTFPDNRPCIGTDWSIYRNKLSIVHIGTGRRVMSRFTNSRSTKPLKIVFLK